MTKVDRPNVFVDEMVKGAFARFAHTHEFRLVEGGTLMIDSFDYTSPLGWLGRIADKLFLEQHLTLFLQTRAQHLKRLEEESGGALRAATT